MDSGEQGCKQSATARTLPESAAPPNLVIAKEWTTERWSSYLPKLKKEVTADYLENMQWQKEELPQLRTTAIVVKWSQYS